MSINAITLSSARLAQHAPSHGSIVKKNIDIGRLKSELLNDIPKKDRWFLGLSKSAAQQKQDAMSTFISSDNFDAFVFDLVEVITTLTEADIECLQEIGVKFNQVKPTANVEKFLKCIAALREAGLHSSEGKQITLWSGRKGKDKAYTVKGFTEGQIPAIFVLFKIYGQVKEIAQDQNLDEGIYERFGRLVSLEFVMNASGPVSIYISNDKQSEPSALKAGNFLWNIELYYLQLLRFSGMVTKINVFLFNQGNWEKYDINDSELKDQFKIPLIRRNIYCYRNGAEDKETELFGENLRGEKLTKWQQTANPRKSISIGRLGYLGRKFINKLRKLGKKPKKISHAFDFKIPSAKKTHVVSLFSLQPSKVDFDEKSNKSEEVQSFVRKSSASSVFSFSDEEVASLSSQMSPSSSILSSSPSFAVLDCTSPTSSLIERSESSPQLIEETSDVNGLDNSTESSSSPSSINQKSRHSRRRKAKEKQNEALNQLYKQNSASSISESSTTKRKSRGLGSTVLSPRKITS